MFRALFTILFFSSLAAFSQSYQNNLNHMSLTDSLLLAEKFLDVQMGIHANSARLQNAGYMRLDSIIQLDPNGNINGKVFFYFNEKDHLVRRDDYRLNSLNEFDLSYKTEFDRTPDGRPTLRTSQKYNKVYEEWSMDNEIKYSYDDNKQLKLVETTIYPSYHEQIHYTYPDPLTTIRTYKNRDENSNKFENSSKFEIYENDDGMQDSTYYYRFVENDWQFNSRTEFVYENGKILEEITHWYDIISESIRRSRELYRYESAKVVVENQNYDDEGDGDGWYTWIKTEFDLDEYGNPINEIFYSGWERLYIKGGPSMSEYSKNEYTYDYQFQLKKMVPKGALIVHEIYDQVVHLPTENHYYRKDTATNSWDLEYGYRWYYSESVITSIDNQSKAPVLLYPNPFKEQVNIKLSKDQDGLLQIYSMTGTKLFDQKVRSGKNIKLDLTPPGVYTYSLEIENRIHRGKLIKQ